MTTRTWSLLGFVALSSAGCGLLLGIDEFKDAPAATGGGATGGGPACAPGEMEACYDGPPATADVGLCRSGKRTCSDDGHGWGPCVGEVRPEEERCDASEDESCDGFDCGIWARIFNNADAEVVDVEVNSQGEVFLLGSFTGTAQLGGNALSAAESGVFLVKLDSTGGHLWSKAFETGFGMSAKGISVNPQGELFVLGYIHSSNTTINFGGDDLGMGLILAKLSGTGEHLWSRCMATQAWTLGESGPASGPVIAVDSSGNAIVAGAYKYAITFDDGPLTSSGASDVFVAKFAAQDGSTSMAKGGWARTFGSSEQMTDVAGAITVDLGDQVIVGGHTSGAIKFGLLAPVGPGAFLVKLNASSNAIWSRSVSAGAAEGLVADLQGNVTVIGQGAYVTSFDALGTLRWSRDFLSNHPMSHLAIAGDHLGNVVATGVFTSDADFGGGAILNGSGFPRIFVAKLDPNGEHLWSRGFGTSAHPVGVGMDPLGQIVLAGSTSAALDFGTGPLTPSPPSDIFLAKLGR